MKVTIRIDDELRKKPYWRNVPDTEEFEYLRDRAPSGTVLKDRQGRMVFCAKDRIVFPVQVAQDSVIVPTIGPVLDIPIENDQTVTKES